MPFILCLVYKNRLKTKELKVFFIYTGLFSLFFLIALYLKTFSHNGALSLLVKRLFLVVEFSLLCFFYNFTLQSRYKTAFFGISIACFTAYSVYDFYSTSAGNFSFVPLVIECFYFLVVIIYFLYEKINYSVSSPIANSPAFWISVAFLIYCAGNFFLFLYSNSMVKNLTMKDANFRNQYNIIYCCVTIIKNIFLCTALLIIKPLHEDEITNKKIDIDLDQFYPLPKNTNL